MTKRKRCQIIEINGYPWKVRRRNLTKRGVLGLSHPDDFIIDVCSSLSDDKYERVLLHEIMHSILAMSGIGSQPNMMSDELEESVVTALEHGLFLLYERKK